MSFRTAEMCRKQCFKQFTSSFGFFLRYTVNQSTEMSTDPFILQFISNLTVQHGNILKSSDVYSSVTVRVQVFIQIKEAAHLNPPGWSVDLGFKNTRSCGLWFVGMKPCAHTDPFAIRLVKEGFFHHLKLQLSFQKHFKVACSVNLGAWVVMYELQL